eukprot:463800_1
MGLEWSTIALIAYASFYSIILIAIAVSHGIKKIWSLRKIYTAVLVHLYDQATDIAVLVQWGILTQQEISGSIDVESVNMLTFFIPGLFFLLLYRVLNIIFVLRESFQNDTKRSNLSIMGNVLLALFDLYFAKVVYDEIQEGCKEPNKKHRKLQFAECLSESVPQVVLQTVFLLKYNTGNDDNVNVGNALVIASIAASILSFANKYKHLDNESVVKHARKANPNSKIKCYISWRYLIVTLWRFSDLCVRIVMFSLIWVCIGGLYIFVYVSLMFLFYYFIVVNRIYANKLYRFLATIIIIIGVLLDYEWHFCVVRCIDNGIMIVIISVFIFLGNYSYTIFVFFVMGLSAYIIELITYPIVQSHKLNIVSKAMAGREFFTIVLFGEPDEDIYDIDEPQAYYLMYYSSTCLSDDDITYFTTKKSAEECKKLSENLQDVFKSCGYSLCDVVIDAKECQVSKYGICIKCLQNMYTKSGVHLLDEESIDFIKSLYNDNKDNIMTQVRNLFNVHFEDRDKEKKWVLSLAINEHETTILFENDAHNIKHDTSDNLDINISIEMQNKMYGNNL